jgi:tetratricopeptide (TPR) repeat protein
MQLALAAAVGLLLLGGGAFGWWQNDQARAVQARLGRNAEAVSALLDQCEAALRAGDAAKAGVVLEAAEKRGAEGGVEDLAGRQERCRADLAVLRDLDAIDQFRWTQVWSKRPHPVKVAVRLREALGRFGANPGAVPAEEVAARVSSSAVRDRLIAALDRWLRGEKLAWVRAVLRVADPHPYRDAVRDTIVANGRAKFAELASRPEAADQPPGFVAFLAESGAINDVRRRELLGIAVRRRPGDLGLVLGLAQTYPSDRHELDDERLRWSQAAVGVAPENPAAHYVLGIAMVEKGLALNELDHPPNQKWNLDGAVAEYKEALRIDPTYASAHNALGIILDLKGDTSGALAEYKEAHRIDPKNGFTRFNLSQALRARGDLDGALAVYKEGVRLDPNNAWEHLQLGQELRFHGDPNGIIAEYQEAIRLDPKYGAAHGMLGEALRHKGDLDGAIAHLKEAIQLDPMSSLWQANLAMALQSKGDLDGAIVHFKEALQIDPGDSLALSLLPGAERTRELLTRLPDILAGRAEPKTPAEACEFARLCAPYQKKYAAATRLYANAFAADPKPVDNQALYTRESAARCAARAARGDGDAANLKPAERSALRQKSLAWLRASLTFLQKQATSPAPGERTFASGQLSYWLKDADLAELRPDSPRSAMTSEERAAWDELWADVKATLTEAQKPTPRLK